MPKIEISEHDFQRLQKIAVPLIDTTETAFTKVLDVYDMFQGSALANAVPSVQGDIEEYGFASVPPLSHTKLLGAAFDGQNPTKITWDSLVQLALIRVMDKCRNVRELQRLSGANVVDGDKHDDGYKYLPSHKFSYQGVSAQDAARIVVRSAKALGCNASFEFEWRNKDAAFKPGERAIVRV